MARVRQARRCRATRTDSAPCRAWAIVGGYVCRAHGAAAPQVRMAARLRSEEGRMLRAVVVALDRQRREWIAMQAHRIAETAELLGKPVEAVTESDILECRFRFGRPKPLDEPPKLRFDCCFGARR